MCTNLVRVNLDAVFVGARSTLLADMVYSVATHQQSMIKNLNLNNFTIFWSQWLQYLLFIWKGWMTRVHGHWHNCCFKVSKWSTINDKILRRCPQWSVHVTICLLLHLFIFSCYHMQGVLIHVVINKITILKWNH